MLVDAGNCRPTAQALAMQKTDRTFPRAALRTSPRDRAATRRTDDGRAAPATEAGAGDPINASPRMVAQRQKIERLFGKAAHMPGNGLPGPIKTGIETLSGMSMDGVRVHYNSSQPAQLNARAYAQGKDIHLSPGQEQHLPHEAWHTVQQAQGRVQPTMNLAGVAVSDDAGLEREADSMGRRALGVTQTLERDRAAQQVADSNQSHAGAVQLKGYPKDAIESLDNLTGIVDLGNETHELNGGKLQDEILERAREAGSSGGYRLGSFLYQPNGTLLRTTEKSLEEAHGMSGLPNTFDVAGIDPYLKGFILMTLKAAKQLDYIQQNSPALFDKHWVVVDVDCQFDRAGTVGFHKDSRGTTAFFNLSFQNEEDMIGPEYYEDLEGDTGLEKYLPEVVKEDIKERRDNKLKKYSHPKDAPIKVKKLGRHGLISISDANRWHSTPLMGHRESTDEHRSAMEHMTREQLLRTLLAQYPSEHHEQIKQNSDEELREDFLDSYHAHAFEEHSAWKSDEEQKGQSMKSNAIKRSRRLSTVLSKKDIQQEALNEMAQKKRTFIRTWVRFVPK